MVVSLPSSHCFLYMPQGPYEKKRNLKFTFPLTPRHWRISFVRDSRFLDYATARLESDEHKFCSHTMLRIRITLTVINGFDVACLNILSRIFILGRSAVRNLNRKITNIVHVHLVRREQMVCKGAAVFILMGSASSSTTST